MRLPSKARAALFKRYFPFMETHDPATSASADVRFDVKAKSGKCVQLASAVAIFGSVSGFDADDWIAQSSLKQFHCFTGTRQLP